MSIQKFELKYQLLSRKLEINLVFVIFIQQSFDFRTIRNAKNGFTAYLLAIAAACHKNALRRTTS